MLTYEYKCDFCEYEFIAEQSIVDPPITLCPKCNENKAKRLISAGTFILKGEGWYKDLYSKPGTAKE